jgi:hypothetical protein
MERDIAIRIDGMLLGVRGNLDGIAHYMKITCRTKSIQDLSSQSGSQCLHSLISRCPCTLCFPISFQRSCDRRASHRGRGLA